MVADVKERQGFAGAMLPSLRGATGPLIGLIVLLPVKDPTRSRTTV